MKKFLVIGLVAIMVVALIAGCGQQKSQPAQQSGGQEQQQQSQPNQQSNQTSNSTQQAALKDGNYYAEEKDFDSHGWKAMVTVIVKDGKISNAFYDEINKDGLLKSFDPNYAKNMKAKTNTTPVDAVAALSKSLIEKQKADSVDKVTGATGTSSKFTALVTQALSSSPVEAKGGLKDGIYSAMEPNFDDHGWKAMASVIVKDGKISAAFYDELNKDDGHFKSTDQAYAKNMEAKTKTTPTKAVESLVKSLLAKQDASQVDAVTGATGTTGKFKTLMGEALSFAK